MFRSDDASGSNDEGGKVMISLEQTLTGRLCLNEDMRELHSMVEQT